MGEDLIKLVIALICGTILGLEREAKHKPLGLKTCIVISVSSCLLTIVSIEIASQHYTNDLLRSDPMRLAAQIVSGIGFLGAGVILRKSNETISGLTTAAIVWAASVLGIAIGAGFYTDTLFGVVFIFLGIKAVPYLMKKIGPKALREQGIKINVTVSSASLVAKVIQEIKSIAKVSEIRIRGTEAEQRIELFCTIDEEENCTLLFYEKLSSISGINRVQIENA